MSADAGLPLGPNPYAPFADEGPVDPGGFTGPTPAGTRNPQEGSAGDPPLFGPPFVRFVVDELAGVKRSLAHIGDRLRPSDTWWRNIATGNLDASGNLTLEVIIVPEGFELFLHRLYVNDNVSTFSNPTTGGRIEIWVDGQVEDGINLASPGLPQVFTSGSSSGIVYGPGEKVEVRIAGATANRAVVAIARGRLIRSRAGRDEP